MRITNYQFQPKLVPSLLVIILLPVLVSLGIWQLNRAEEKREILQNQKDNLARPAIEIRPDTPLPDNLEDRRLVLQGTFEPRFQILIDNKVAEGQVGYEIVTPLRIADSERFVLVNRGWIAQGESRDKLPEVQTPVGSLEVTGVARVDTKDVLGSANRIDRKWPALVRWLDIEALREETGLDLMPFVLLLDKTAAHGFVRNWKFVNAPPEKSISYAVQWFTLALALLIIYIVVNTRKISREE